ncbi:class I SAM-dependent methyltransferase [Microcoleus sp. FACHB-68]|uniref:class I SAM-dependent methyltransferase n=1 Tax=Microcoleus sp. FACHB-68 TaxID=2692826 RepID=UPI00168A1A8D|nr:class I SAM-dependent methyltransferase [Microcoleus sp. FACHB-68]MBD1938811.1 class I SAM-dependent methyltransferase [Microcoleus sp. FACHB-68]
MTPQETLMPAEQNIVITDSATLDQSITNRVDSWIVTRGELSLPCVPALLDKYVERLQALFESIGKPWKPEELERLRQLLAQKLATAFETSPHSRIIVKYETDKFPSTPTKRLVLSVSVLVSTVEDEYKMWTQTREPPLFGKHPDAKVMAVAAELGEPASAAILDVGAGTGRNTLPLARLGYPVQALEMVPAFLRQILAVVNAEGLPVMVTPGNILDPKIELPKANYKLAIVAEVVSHFRSVEQLKHLLTKMAEVLRPGGLLLFNMFLTIEGYEPDAVVRQMSEVAWSSLFTPAELAAALEGLPLELVSDESVYEYEQEHLPAEAWPPTGWFTQWAAGRDLFPISDGLPPIELRWLLYRRL